MSDADKTYLKIATAYTKNRGVRLSVDDVHGLVANDSCIYAVVQDLLRPPKRPNDESDIPRLAKVYAGFPDSLKRELRGDWSLEKAYAERGGSQ